MRHIQISAMTALLSTCCRLLDSHSVPHLQTAAFDAVKLPSRNVMLSGMVYHAKKAAVTRTRLSKILAAPPAHKHAVELLLVNLAYDSLRGDRQLMGQRLLAPAAAAVVDRPSLVARIPVGSAIGQDSCRGCSERDTSFSTGLLHVSDDLYQVSG